MKGCALAPLKDLHAAHSGTTSEWKAVLLHRPNICMQLLRSGTGIGNKLGQIIVCSPCLFELADEARKQSRVLLLWRLELLADALHDLRVPNSPVACLWVAN